MAARKKDPTPGEQIEALEGLRAEKEARRDGAQTALSNAYDMLGQAESGPNISHPGPPRPPADGSPTIPERLRAAKRMEELDREHEPFEAIREAAGELQNVIKISRETVEATTDAISTLTDEIATLRAEHRAYFVGLAEAGSAAADAQLDRLLTTFEETVKVLKDTWGRWGLVGIPVSATDLAHARLELQEVRRECCWPCRSEAAYRASQPTTAPEHPGAKVSNAAALAEGRAGV
jgi:hypothetical protein